MSKVISISMMQTIQLFSQLTVFCHVVPVTVSVFVIGSGEDKGLARRAQHDQFFYLKLFFSMPIMDEKMPIL